MSEKRFRVRFEQEDGRGEIVNEKGVELTAREVVDCLNEQQVIISDLEAENEKNCGHCKHFQIDGMFGFWCEKDHDWTLWTNCRYDICEIVNDDEIICIVALNDADKIIGLLEENERLKTENKKLRKTERSWRKIHCCNDESDNCGILQSLSEENKQLKGLIKKTLEITPIEHNLAVELKNSVREFYE